MAPDFNTEGLEFTRKFVKNLAVFKAIFRISRTRTPALAQICNKLQ
jgi:hypothetical protein